MLFQPIKLMLATMRHKACDDDNYISEPKWDGWRILIHKQRDRIETYTRHGNNVTRKFPELREVSRRIHAQPAVLDCEGICLRDGRSVFDDFAYRCMLRDERRISASTQTHPATFVAFDMVYSHRDHTHETVMARKDHLAGIIVPSA